MNLWDNLALCMFLSGFFFSVTASGVFFFSFLYIKKIDKLLNRKVIETLRIFV